MLVKCNGSAPAYLHLFHKFEHLLRRQTGHSSADGLWGLLWLDTVAIRRLNDGGSCSQTCAKPKSQDAVAFHKHLLIKSDTAATFEIMQRGKKILTFQLLLIFLTGCIVHTESPTTELSPIQVPHGTKSRLLVLIFTEAISLWLSCLPVVY